MEISERRPLQMPTALHLAPFEGGRAELDSVVGGSDTEAYSQQSKLSLAPVHRATVVEGTRSRHVDGRWRGQYGRNLYALARRRLGSLLACL